MRELDNLKKKLEEEIQKNFLLQRELELTKQETRERNVEGLNDTYKSVIEAAEDIIFKTDLNGNFTYVNPAAEKSIGYGKNEMIGLHFLSLIRVDYQQKIFDAFQKQFKERASSTYTEFPVIKKDRSVIWVGQNVQLDYVGDWIIGFSAIARDITARKKSEEELNIVNSRFESIFNNLNLGLLLEDADRKIIMINQRFCELFQYTMSPDEMIGLDCKAGLDSMIDFFKNGKEQIAFFETCIENKVIVLAQEVLLSDGRIFECDYIPVFVGENYTGHLWKYRDITEQETAKKLLKQNEEKYRLIIQNMNLGLLVVDNSGVVVDVNPSFCDMTGFTTQELLGKRADSIFLTEGDEDVMQDAVNKRKLGESSAYEIRLKNKFGKNMWMLISGSPIFDAHNKIIGSIGIHLDITDRKQQMVELTEARLKAEQSAHSKEMFLANMSHEIRTPMNVIQGMARLLEEASLSQKQKEYLDAIQISSQHLLVIINDILDFSKIDLEKMELENAAFSLQPMLKNLILQFEIKAQEKNLVFEHTIDPEVTPVLIGDSVRLIQILNNLLGNSVKFTNEGKVAFQCTLLEDKAETQVLKFEITDTGIGIDEDKRELIFESFMQENPSINRQFGGTGLGLSISRKLVQLFGGKLEFQSVKGKGSVFSFSIELKKGSDVDFVYPIENKAVDLSILKDKFVLLAEDNHLNQFLATIILEKMGMKVTVANNGYEAIEAIIDKKFDVVLMDLQMPGIDGLAATYMIRNKLKSTIPIIALTANAIKGDKELCLNAGMNDYVSKPIDSIELGAKLASVLSGKSVIISQKSNTMEEDVPPYNLEKLRRDVGGDENFVKQMVQLFCELGEETIVNIDQAIAEKKYDLIKKYAHKIKASIDTLEIVELKSKVREIENEELLTESFVNKKVENFKVCLNFACLLLKKNELNK